MVHSTLASGPLNFSMTALYRPLTVCNGANQRRPTESAAREPFSSCMPRLPTQSMVRLSSQSPHSWVLPHPTCFVGPGSEPQSLALSQFFPSTLCPQGKQTESHNICGTQDPYQRLFRLLDALLLSTQDWVLDSTGTGLGEQKGEKA